MRIFQVMYMYYLLGYRLFGSETKFVRQQLNQNGDTYVTLANLGKNKAKQPWAESVAKAKQHFGKSLIFDLMEEALLLQVGMTSWHRKESDSFAK